MAKISAVLFDMDGTLRDSRPAILPAVQHAFAANELTVPELEAIIPYVHSLHAVHETLAPQVPYEAFRQSYGEKLQSLMNLVVVYEGVADDLRGLQEHYRLGVVSSGRYAREELTADGLDTFFDVIVGGTDVTELKPDPEPVLLALEQLAVEPGKAVMVGDLSADIVAAKAAHLAASVGITHGFSTREQLEQAGADYVIDALGELPAVLEKLD
ncbi:MAG TPA: HAD-IA family hydrolase [Candidatus Saccharimonadales bacterium]